jgi:hypothetical protein
VRNDYAALNHGQLKTVAKVFYDRLIAVGYTTSYPWTTTTADDQNYAAANLGQVKQVFSFDLTAPVGQLPVWWQTYYFQQSGIDPSGDSDGDGLTNLTEYQAGSNPTDYYNGQTPQLQIVSGNNQIGGINTFLPTPLVVRVKDSSGTINKINAPVNFSVASGGGSLSFSTSGAPTTFNSVTLRTDSNGLATLDQGLSRSLYFRSPSAVGTSTVNAVAGTAPTGTFSFTTTNTLTPPTAPSNFASIQNPDGSWTFTWQDNSTNEDTFTIQVQASNGSFTTLGSVSSNQTSFALSAAAAQSAGLSGSSNFQVSSTNFSGTSSSNQSNPPPMPIPRYAVVDLGADRSAWLVSDKGQVLEPKFLSDPPIWYGWELWRWESGEWQKLDYITTSWLSPVGGKNMMNSQGVVVAYGPGPSYGDNVGLTWAAGTTTATQTKGSLFDLYTDVYGQVIRASYNSYYAIADNGTIYGYTGTGVESGGLKIEPYATPGGSLPANTDVFLVNNQGPVDRVSLASNFSAIDSNNDGILLLDDASTNSVSWWDGSAHTVVGITMATAINTRKTQGVADYQIVGRNNLVGVLMEKPRDPQTNLPTGDYQATPLTNLVSPQSGWSSFSPQDISDQNGLICGTGTFNGQNHGFLLLPTEWITPAGDPVNAAIDGGDGSGTVPDGANEFTYSTAASGVLTLKLKAKISGIGNLGQTIQDQFKFEVDTIGNSTMAWDTANPGGKVTVSGDYITAKVKFTGLPQNNSDFGKKKARVMLNGSKTIEKEFEVFFPRDTKNHPGVGSGTTPNWFYYWGQVMGGSHDLQYGGPGSGSTVAEVLAITAWNYTSGQDKDRMIIYDGVTGKFRAYGVGEEFSGIDQFFGTVIHEAKHVDQVSRADTLVPTGTSGSPWQHGWSFNQGLAHNHWTKGSDGKPGVAGVDDDGDGTVDNLIATGSGELGRGDDIDLTHPFTTSRNWPASWPPPTPLIYPLELEAEAINASDAAHDEHKRARHDWGSPGKNHKTVDRYDD